MEMLSISVLRCIDKRVLLIAPECTREYFIPHADSMAFAPLPVPDIQRRRRLPYQVAVISPDLNNAAKPNATCNNAVDKLCITPRRRNKPELLVPDGEVVVDVKNTRTGKSKQAINKKHIGPSSPVRLKNPDTAKGKYKTRLPMARKPNGGIENKCCLPVRLGRRIAISVSTCDYRACYIDDGNK